MLVGNAFTIAEARSLGVSVLQSLSAQSLLQKLTESSYRIDVDEAFVRRFFDDRKCVSTATRTFFERDNKFRNLLLAPGLPITLQLGTNMFGQSTVEEHFVLDSVIRSLKPKTILEVGIFRGHTAVTMCRALSQTTPDYAYMGIDIDDVAIEIATSVLNSLGLASNVEFIKADSNNVLASMAKPDFVFIDGDHAYQSVASDFVATYNKVDAGAVIALHDVGCKSWGFHQDPGWLFFKVLPALLKDRVVQSWLDSMCRELTMRMLSPNLETDKTYCKNNAESLELARLTSSDIINGAGGLGFIMKLDGSHKLNLDDILAAAPPALSNTITAKASRGSLLGRAARKLANFIP